MIIKNKSLGILAGFFLVLTLISFVSACAFQLIIESPEEGAVYIQGEDVILRAKAFSTTNTQIKMIAKVSYPDSSFDIIALEENAGVYEAIIPADLVGDYSVKFRAEDNFGNVESEIRHFSVEEETPPFNLIDLFVHSPENNDVYDLGDDVLFSAEVFSILNVQVKVIAKVKYPDSSIETFNLYENSGIYEHIFEPNLEGDYEVAFYAEDIYGNYDYEIRHFSVEEETPPFNDLDLNILSPGEGQEFEAFENILFEAEILSSGDVEKNVWVVLVKEDGFEFSFNLETSDEVIYSKVLDDLDEGIYTATFYVEDNLGNTDNGQTFFIVEEDFGVGGGVSGEDEYYVCTLWSDWSNCKNGVQERTCLQEKIVDFSSGETSLVSLIGFKQYKNCVTGYQISDIPSYDDKSSFDLFFWLSLFLALFVLVGFVLVVVVLRRR